MVKIGNMNPVLNNVIRCQPVFQNQQDFLIGVFSIGDIFKFTKYTKRLIVGYDDSNIPIYNNEIQRKLENPRVQKIADFLIEDPNATFPTNIVLHIPSPIIDSQELDNGVIEIRLNQKVYEGVAKSKRNDESGDVYITIIDGQHRIRGIEVALERIENDLTSINQTLQGAPHKSEIKEKFEFYSKRKSDLLKIQLAVSFFVDKTLEYQAMVFSTINRTQKRVSDSLVSSLFGITAEDSPQKTALQIVLALNAHPKSPFYNRINLYGNSYARNQSPPLSQATMVKSILERISENPREAERDRNRKRRELLGPVDKFLPFRRYYAVNNDSCISDIFFYYFTAVREVFISKDGKSYWEFNPESMKPTNVLQATVGYFALLNILSDILKTENVNGDDVTSTEFYKGYLVKTKAINLEDLKNYPLTSKSKTLLYLDMSLLIWPPADLNDERIKRRKELEAE